MDLYDGRPFSVYDEEASIVASGGHSLLQGTNRRRAKTPHYRGSDIDANDIVALKIINACSRGKLVTDNSTAPYRYVECGQARLMS